MVKLWNVCSAWAYLSGRNEPKDTYYFAYGSNMLPETMSSLRSIRPVNATAAVLKDYRLRFNIASGSRLIEPSAACIEYSPGNEVHGVLYALDSEQDWKKIASTEGVPFVYRWERVQVIPYKGDGELAGDAAFQSGNLATSGLTLVAAYKTDKDDLPPSPSYLEILQQGTAYWRMDKSYQKFLRTVQTADNLFVAEGLSGLLLKTAMIMNPSLRSS